MNEKPMNENKPVVPVAASVPQRVAVLSSAELFRGANEVLIEHKGAVYRLRQTSLGKLILTK